MPLFAYAAAWSGMPQATFFVVFVVTLIATIWMHLSVVSMLHKASPQLKGKIENDSPTLTGATS
jgi:MFS transporter, NNP family, nitrate/nitrite transporter